MSKIFSFLFLVPNDSTISSFPLTRPSFTRSFVHSLIAHRFHPLHSCRAQLFILYYYSFSIQFRDYLATILNVSVGFLFLFCVTCSLFTLLVPFLLYLFLFGLSLFLFCLQREQPSLLPCVFFTQNLSQKRHNPCFLVLPLSVLLFCDCSNCTFLRFFSEHGPVMVLF